jgi:hypothetical protein
MPRMVKTTKMLTPRKFAALQGVAYTTVMNWLQRGMITGAVKHPLPSGSHYWEVPETATAPELQPGRPSKKGSKK